MMDRYPYLQQRRAHNVSDARTNIKGNQTRNEFGPPRSPSPVYGRFGSGFRAYNVGGANNQSKENQKRNEIGTLGSPSPRHGRFGSGTRSVPSGLGTHFTSNGKSGKEAVSPGILPPIYGHRPSTREANRKGHDKGEKKASTEKELRTKTQELLKLQQENEELNSRHRESNSSIARLNRDVRDLKEKVLLLRREKDQLMNRLSAAVGATLTDNNADIADISDVNRPTKLAEYYTELYDNQWTDAFDELTDNGAMTDQDASNLLLEVFVETYKVCKSKAETDLEALLKSLEQFYGSEPPKQISKQMKDERKKQTSKQLAHMKTEMKGHVATMYPGKKFGKYFEAFLVRSVELCWFMVIQDPPVHVDTVTMKSDKTLDKLIYKPYTRSGKTIDFIVWPVLYLQEGGAVLCKGVAEGKADKKDTAKLKDEAPVESINVKPYNQETDSQRGVTNSNTGWHNQSANTIKQVRSSPPDSSQGPSKFNEKKKGDRANIGDASTNKDTPVSSRNSNKDAHLYPRSVNTASTHHSQQTHKTTFLRTN